MSMTIKMSRMIEEIDAADMNELTDIILLAAQRLCITGNTEFIKVHGTSVQTHNTIDVMIFKE